MTCLNCNHSSGNHSVPWPYEQEGSCFCYYREDDKWCQCTFLKLKEEQEVNV